MLHVGHQAVARSHLARAAHYQPVKTFTYDRCECSPMVLYARK